MLPIADKPLLDHQLSTQWLPRLNVTWERGIDQERRLQLHCARLNNRCGFSLYLRGSGWWRFEAGGICWTSPSPRISRCPDVSSPASGRFGRRTGRRSLPEQSVWGGRFREPWPSRPEQSLSLALRWSPASLSHLWRQSMAVDVVLLGQQRCCCFPGSGTSCPDCPERLPRGTRRASESTSPDSTSTAKIKWAPAVNCFEAFQ